MRDFAILWPPVALAALTFGVWVLLYARRIPFLRGADLQVMAVRDGRPLTPAFVSAPSDNLQNLFEMPVLFYVVCLALAVTGQATPALVTAAWVYVALRAVHSLIHCTYNTVLHRFLAYALSSLVLAGMWVGFALSL